MTNGDTSAATRIRVLFIIRGLTLNSTRLASRKCTGHQAASQPWKFAFTISVDHPVALRDDARCTVRIVPDLLDTFSKVAQIG